VRLRFPAILLSVWFTLLGTGAAEFAHNLQHRHDDHLAAAAAAAEHANTAVDDHDDSDPGSPVHSDSNCPTHAQLHLPLMAGAWVPPLVLSTASVPLVPPPPASLVSHRSPARIDCRGPPALLSPLHLAV
jgi:hypothetical protein